MSDASDLRAEIQAEREFAASEDARDVADLEKELRGWQRWAFKLAGFMVRLPGGDETELHPDDKRELYELIGEFNKWRRGK